MEKLQDGQVEEAKKAKALKEIQEIAEEKEKIHKLLETNDEEELRKYLDIDLTQKYYIEKAIHNLASSSFPETVVENASNALFFLDNLKTKSRSLLQSRRAGKRFPESYKIVTFQSPTCNIPPLY